MSTTRLRRHRAGDEGFTLMEVLISMALLAIVMTSALPALIAMLKTTVTVKADTLGKNLTQERVEQMRDLRFHVDRQNGPFLDLLDIYYTNASTTAPATSLTIGGTALVGQYVSTGGGTGGEPTAPFFRVTAAAVSGQPGYSETIDSQFLTPNGSVIPMTSYQGVYDSQTVGSDQPPSLFLGVTVITKWTDAGKTRTLKTTTRITDSRAAAPVIQTQSRAIAVDISSTAANGSTLELQGGVSTADGAQSSGSTVAGYATGALATVAGVLSNSGLAGQFSLPLQAVSSSSSTNPQSGGPGCSWYGFGRSGLTDVTGDISTGLPKAPADVDNATPNNSLSGYIADNSGGSCGLLSFDNLANGGVARPNTDPVAYEMGSAPYVKAPDTGGGNAAAISGSSYVTSNTLTSVPQKSKSGAATLVNRAVVLFPNNPESGGRGLVSVTLTQGSVDCATGSPGTAVGKYTLTLGWWGKRVGTDASAKWHTATWTYDSSVSANPVLGSGSDVWDPTHTVLGNGTTLDQLVSTTLNSSGPATIQTGGDNGMRGFSDGALTLTTASTLSNESGPGFSAIKVQIGRMTCVADDTR